MKIKLINFGAKENNLIGNRAHYNDAGFDVYCQEDFVIKTGETKSVGIGLGFEIPDGMAGFIMPKSGLSSKGITSQLSPIDSGYRGEVHAILHNTGKDYSFKKGDKVGQLVVFPIVTADFEWELDNSRGAGAFGSTGK